jgi:hypothetical protein
MFFHELRDCISIPIEYAYVVILVVDMRKLPIFIATASWMVRYEMDSSVFDLQDCSGSLEHLFPQSLYFSHLPFRSFEMLCPVLYQKKKQNGWTPDTLHVLSSFPLAFITHRTCPCIFESRVGQADLRL